MKTRRSVLAVITTLALAAALSAVSAAQQTSVPVGSTLGTVGSGIPGEGSTPGSRNAPTGPAPRLPNGRPDFNGFWLGTGAVLNAWNALIQFNHWTTNHTTFDAQTPPGAAATATGVVEYWVGRMVGHALAPSRMSALIEDQGRSVGVPAARKSSNAEYREQAYWRLISLIATTEEFSYR